MECKMLELNKIYQGDCLQIIKNIDDKSIDLIVTDPPYEYISKSPYGGGFMSNENKKHLVAIRDSFGMSFNPKDFLQSIQRIMKKFNLYIYTNKSLLTEYINFAEDNKYKWEIIVWLKTNPVPIFNGHYLIDKEYILYIKEAGATFNSNLGYDNYFTYFFHPIGRVGKVTNHPTEKSIEPIKRFIRISSNENDLILDPFCGSGTTLVATKRLNRNYIGIELEPKYVEIANRRIRELPQQLF